MRVFLRSPKPPRAQHKEKQGLFLQDACFFEVAEAPAGASPGETELVFNECMFSIDRYITYALHILYNLYHAYLGYGPIYMAL